MVEGVVAVAADGREVVERRAVVELVEADHVVLGVLHDEVPHDPTPTAQGRGLAGSAGDGSVGAAERVGEGRGEDGQ